MRFLSLSDRQEASLTCKRWYQASLDPGLHKNTIITIRAPTAPSSQLRQLGQNKSANLVLSHIDSSSSCRTVLKETGRHLGPHLESLSLKGSDVTSSVFMDILSNCPNIQVRFSNYSLIAFDERVTFWLQRVRSLPCACAYVSLFARRLVYNRYAIAHAYNAASMHAQGSDPAR